MAKKGSKGDKQAADALPSAILLGELDRLQREADEAKRSRRAWEIVTGTWGNSDFYGVLDFALDKGLVAAADVVREEEITRTPSWVNPIDGSEMVWIPPGPFVIGEETKPAECAGFSLARYPVTNAQFKAFLDATKYEPHAGAPGGEEEDEDEDDSPWPGRFLRHWPNRKIPKGQDKHPVVYVSYLDALAYCKWAGLTLPTQWLWEKAARGPEGRPYPWGTTRPRESKSKLANVRSTATIAVGSYPRVRTPYGCEDMIGNVSEWCQFGDADNPGAMPASPPAVEVPEEGDEDYAPVRGSCFLRSDDKRMYASHQRKLRITRRNHWTGFRPALLLPIRPAV